MEPVTDTRRAEHFACIPRVGLPPSREIQAHAGVIARDRAPATGFVLRISLNGGDPGRPVAASGSLMRLHRFWTYPSRLQRPARAVRSRFRWLQDGFAPMHVQ